MNAPQDNSIFTRAPLDPSTSDQAWNGNFDRIAEFVRSMSSNLESEEGAPQLCEIFLGYTAASPPSGMSDYGDARYFVRRAIPDPSNDSTDQLELIDDPFANSNLSYRSYVTATNIAELPSSTPTGNHSLRANTKVLVFGFGQAGQFEKRTYAFDHAVPRPIFVHLQLNGSTPGSNGSVSLGVVTNATYKYDLLFPDTGDPIPGNTTALTPAGTREQGPLVGPATIGMARLGPDGTTWTLIWCDERRAVIACP